MTRTASTPDGTMLLVDKPLGWTSFDVVKKIRNVLKVRKAGHGGTLDPQATGLLIVCTGAKTKMLSSLLNVEKEYTGTIELGVRSASFDAETEVTERRDWSNVSAETLDQTRAFFVGHQTQLPPMYSAVKFEGKPLYTYARRGQVVPRLEREIEIKTFDLVELRLPYVDFRVVCSKGTYVRSLIDDFGQRLGCGALVTKLRRTRVGDYSVEDALTIDELVRQAPVAERKAGWMYEGSSTVQ